MIQLIWDKIKIWLHNSLNLITQVEDSYSEAKTHLSQWYYSKLEDRYVYSTSNLLNNDTFHMMQKQCSQLNQMIVFFYHL